MKRNTPSGIACLTCRRRGRKCDRTLPKCASCHRRGVDCEGYALRWVGLAARGKLAGQTFEAVSDAAPTGSSPLKGQFPQQKNYAFASHGTPLTSSRFCHPDSAKVFIQYYAREISTAFFLGNGVADTPCTAYILPMTNNVSCVRYAVAATACCHMANRLQDDKLKTESLHLRLKATEALRLQLDDDVEGTDLSSLACIMLLAQLDLCSGDCLEFTTHLKAANELIQRRGSDGTDRAYFQQRLAWLEIMNSTTSPETPHLSRDNIDASLNRVATPNGRDWGFDVFECPIDLFRLLVDAVHLQKSQGASLTPSEEILEAASILMNDIKTWKPVDIRSQDMLHIVELWRNGIMLFLARLFDLQNEAPDIPRILDEVFQRAVGLSMGKPRKFATSWPLFQAGLALRCDAVERKQWLQAEFMTQFRTLGCCNPRLAAVVLERVWETGDCGLVNSQRLIF